MLIDLPVTPKLTAKAKEEGFETVDEYVRHLVEEEVGELTPAVDDSPQAKARRLLAAFSDLPGSNPDFDDSRESIYEGR